MMTLNRYRLRHLVKKGHKGALRVSSLLARPDRLIGLILLGNNFVNLLASAITTIIALRLLGEAGVLPSTFSDPGDLDLRRGGAEDRGRSISGKTGLPAALVLTPLLKLLQPLVWIVNAMANGVLRLFRIEPIGISTVALSREELRTVVMEAGALIPKHHQQMLSGILDLEKVTVEDIMVPRNEIFGIDLDHARDELDNQLSVCRHTRLPIYRGNIDDVLGMLHVRKIPRLYDDEGELDLSRIQSLVSGPLLCSHRHTTAYPVK